ncbi:MAG: Hsp20 family protein [Euryarchaeota archaeon]|nr:Hsp20 family protein [Euryarchaeota archaeon]
MWKRRGFFGNFFEALDEMEREFERLFRDALRTGGGGPWYYGYRYQVGPDGKPVVETYGNLPGMTQLEGVNLEALDSDTREPYTDVIVDDDQVVITAEMPGVDKKDVKLSGTSKGFEIRAETENRKYRKVLSFEQEIDPKTAKATYNNGVLEVKVKLKEKKPKGIKIKVE